MAAWQCTQTLIQSKKAAQADLIPPAWRLASPTANTVLDVRFVPEASAILTPLELEITELGAADVGALLRKLASGEWSAVQVVTAYAKRAAVAHQVTNCLTEIFFDMGIEQAKELDRYFAEHGKPVGPLHGLPISLKDQFDVEGVECTMGYASWLGRFSSKDAVVVSILRSAGAVFYCKTNVPQTLMMGETSNHIFGTTSNPFNRSLSCGGSSGGEGALLGMKASPLGVGTDIGGSIRIPAACQGLYGLRPTMRRLPYYGTTNSMEGQEAIESVLGPISHSLAGCVAFTKAVLGGRPWELDPKTPEIPWNEDRFRLADLEGGGRKLCFGFMEWDGVVRPHPPVQRALREVKEALVQAGHSVIEWKPLNHDKAIEIISKLYSADGDADFTAVTKESGEPRVPGLVTMEGAGLSVYENWQLNKQRDDLRKAYLEKWMATASATGTGRPIDGVICPILPHAAPVHREFTYLNYSLFVNFYDLPSCVFPVTSVDPALDPVDSAYKPSNELDEINYKRYMPERYANAPICLQLIGRRFRDEQVLGLVDVVAAALGRK